MVISKLMLSSAIAIVVYKIPESDLNVLTFAFRTAKLHGRGREF